jgi:hypothetical protein
MEQVKTCANSFDYKNSSGLRYGATGFLVSFIILYMILKKVFNTGFIDSSNIQKYVFIASISIITYLLYNYGYDQADYNSVLMAYQKDKQELDSRQSRFKTREDNIKDLEEDRQNKMDAYYKGSYYGNNSFGWFPTIQI